MVQARRAADRSADDRGLNDALAAVYGLLEQQAQAIGVRQLVVAVDDPQCGRQIFSSDRRPLRPSLALRCGAPVWTEPTAVVPLDLERQLLASVAGTFRRACERDDALEPLRSAVARALRYGWSFTLVCVNTALPGDGLRAGDTLLHTGAAESLLIVASARDEEVPAILARLTGNDRPLPLTFGLVHCPGDGTEPGELVDQARRRLVDAAAQLSVRAIGSAGR